MARKLRIHFPGAVYHVMIRGNAGEDIFFSDVDRYRFYLILQESIEKFDFRVHGFCCMTNHVHLVAQVGTLPLSLALQNISQRYTRWINSSQHRTGHIFQGRYKAILIEANSYLVPLIRYIHRNPIRAMMVLHAEDYPWSSHRVYLGTEVIPWLTTDWVLSMFCDRENIARERYEVFVADGAGEQRRSEYHCGTYDGRILGDDAFAEEVLSKAHEHSHLKYTCEDVVGIVCRFYKVSEQELRSPGKTRQYSEARAVVALIVTETAHLSLTKLSGIIDRDLSAIGKSVLHLKQKKKPGITRFWQLL